MSAANLINRHHLNKSMNPTHRPRKAFSFDFPLNKRVVDLSRPRGYRVDFICNLGIQGYAELNPHASVLDTPDDRFSVDIDYIMHEGNNIKEVLEHTNLFDEIYNACLQHASLLFTEIENDLYEREEGGEAA